MKKNKRTLTLLFPISLLIISLSLAYYLVWFLPNKQKADQTLQLELYERKTKVIQECIDKGNEKIKEARNNQCKILGRGDDCGLPKDMALRYDTAKTEMRDDCIKQYSI